MTVSSALVVDLAARRNNVGITAADDIAQGAFNVWGNSFPAEELPTGSATVVDDVPFDFPPVAAGQADNVRCQGQLVDLTPGRYDWLYLLAAGERRVEDEMAFHFADGSIDFEPLRISDFWAAAGVFGETPAFVTATMHYPHHVQQRVPAMLWCQRVPVVRRADLVAARLPDNPAVHIFAATLLRAASADVALVSA